MCNETHTLLWQCCYGTLHLKIILALSIIPYDECRASVWVKYVVYPAGTFILYAIMDQNFINCESQKGIFDIFPPGYSIGRICWVFTQHCRKSWRLSFCSETENHRREVSEGTYWNVAVVASLFVWLQKKKVGGFPTVFNTVLVTTTANITLSSMTSALSDFWISTNFELATMIPETVPLRWLDWRIKHQSDKTFCHAD